jgi:hypothetical protein
MCPIIILHTSISITCHRYGVSNTKGVANGLTFLGGVLGIEPNIVVGDDLPTNRGTGIITGFTTFCGMITPKDTTYETTRVGSFTFATVAYL